MKNRLYHQALVCEYGHLITSDLSKFVSPPASHCPQCGQSCISTCPSCGSPIRGDCYERQPIYGACYPGSLWGDSDSDCVSAPKEFVEVAVEPYAVPAYCHTCGSPYPWTASLLDEADRIVDLMDELTPEQKKTLKGCFPSLLSDMPATPGDSLIAAKLLQSVSSIAKTALQNLLAEHVTAFVLSLLGWKS